ncbi:unnamed protein product [[Candida] boidinii]|nr:unnamed protein product [[Candida] boidinii]
MQLKLIKPEDNQSENDILRLMNGSDSISQDNNNNNNTTINNSNNTNNNNNNNSNQLNNPNNLNTREIDLISKTRMIKHSLNDNFEFSMVDTDDIVEDAEEDAEDELINTGGWEKGLFDHEYVDNFVRVINNFDKYSSIGDAFKDWLKNTIGDNNDSKINKIEKKGLISGSNNKKSNNDNNDDYDNNDDDDDQMVQKHHNDFF